MDKSKLVDLLNEDLCTEFKSIVQYVQHVATIKGAEYQSLIEELRGHLSQEVEHATILAEQIDFLGGTPSTDVPTVPSCPDAKEALELDLDLERTQLDRYRQRVKDAEEAGLPDVAEALRPILQQTQDHVMDLETALGK